MQYDLPLIDAQVTTGTELAAFLNNWAAALESAHSGVARPPYAGEGLMWLDKSAGVNAWRLWMFDGAQDMLIGTFNSTTNFFIPSVGGKPAATADDAIAYAIALG